MPRSGEGAPGGERVRGHGARAFKAVLGAELLLLLRDRRALLLAVVLPTLLYPMVFLGQRWLERSSRRTLEQRTVRVLCDLAGLESSRRLVELLKEQEPIEVLAVDASSLRALDDPRPDAGDPEPAVSLAERAEFHALSRGPPGKDAGLEGREARGGEAHELRGEPGGKAGGEEGTVLLLARKQDGDPMVSLRLYFDGANDLSLQARRRAEQALDRFQAERRARIAEERIGRDPARGLSLDAVDVASPADRGGAWLGRTLPLLAVIVLLSGASYAALSTFAGEREAGTLETLLAHPAPASAVVAAKFTAVLAAGILTLSLNAASVLLCLRAGLGTIPGAPEGAGTGDLVGPALASGRFLAAGVVFLPAAALLCALLCLACGRARTFREGQYTLMPLMLVCLLPVGIASQEVDLDWLLAAVPITGPALALRDVLRGELRPAIGVWMFVANTFWAGLALRRLARTLDTERLVQTRGGEEETALRSLQSRYALRWAWVAVFLVYVLGGSLQAWDLTAGILLTLWGLLPLLALLSARGTARRAGESVATTLGLVRPRLAHALGAVLVAPALAAFARVVFEWQTEVLPLPSRLEAGEILQDLANLPLPWRIFLLAISPAICEELFFRGALLSGLRRDLGVASCLAWEALVFGAAHSSIHRFVPTAYLGMALTAVTLRARSIFPAMLLHASYNAVLLLELDRAWLAWLTWLAIPGIGLILAARPTGQAQPGAGSASRVRHTAQGSAGQGLATGDPSSSGKPDLDR